MDKIDEEENTPLNPDLRNAPSCPVNIEPSENDNSCQPSVIPSSNMQELPPPYPGTGVVQFPAQYPSTADGFQAPNGL